MLSKSYLAICNTGGVVAARKLMYLEDVARNTVESKYIINPTSNLPLSGTVTA